MEITHLDDMPLVAEPMQDGIYEIYGEYWTCVDDYLRKSYDYEIERCH